MPCRLLKLVHFVCGDLICPMSVVFPHLSPTHIITAEDESPLFKLILTLTQLQLAISARKMWKHNRESEQSPLIHT